MDYEICILKKEQYSILADFLYEAIYVPKGMEPPPRNIIQKPELQLYISDFGRPDDYALAAQVEGRMVGAAWARIMPDYGHIDNDTPSLAISLYREYRSMGIGTGLMRGLLQLLKRNGYKMASLSVQKGNYAFRMYQRLGFEVITEHGGEVIMIKHL